MQSISSQPYSKRPVPTPKDAKLADWADRLAAWLATEFGNVQRGSIRASSQTVTADYTAKVTDGLILVDATLGNVDVTLPLPATVHDMQVCIKRIDGSGNTVTIIGTIDATTDPTLAQWEAWTIWADISSAPAGTWSLVALVT